MKKFLKKLAKTRAGFTMIELLVATTVFIIAMTIVTTVFLIALRTQRIVIAIIAANDNTFLALEQIAREVRVGSDFKNIGGTELRFTNVQGNEVRYRLHPAGGGRGELRRREGTGGGSGTPITAENVDVKDFQVTIRGCLNPGCLNDLRPAQVTLTLQISTVGTNVPSVVTHIQTTTSVRNLDS
jgi:hypothetical protein